MIVCYVRMCQSTHRTRLGNDDGSPSHPTLSHVHTFDCGICTRLYIIPIATHVCQLLLQHRPYNRSDCFLRSPFQAAPGHTQSHTTTTTTTLRNDYATSKRLLKFILCAQRRDITYSISIATTRTNGGGWCRVGGELTGCHSISFDALS